ncbi:hypothetical protein DSLASN_39330 [Desulfoluna limicola]|uniref:diguanylate cyclase n=2 Tax=Desulfoluna limicola TaxID=2810562 RepID=A0ABM7PM40_9BACT|nr:hypothetical protein DSLASN_39330 [Desulfoluna limicola]
MIVRELQDHNYTVLEASTAEDALEMITREVPDLITLETVLPDGDGFSLCKTLTEPGYTKYYAQSPTGHLPVIFITEHDTLEERRKGFEIGAADFLAKPFYRGDVLKAVNNIVRPNKRLIGLTALVVDDSQMARRISAEPLRREGLTVFECSDGDEALCFMEKMHKKIDIVITDLKMPKMGGDTLCLKLRQDLGLTDLPIIFLTAISDHTLLLDMFKVGATDYLVKPFVKEELIARLRVHLERAQLTKNLRRIIGSLKKANDEIRTLSITDPLTGCYNRNYMGVQLKKEIRTAQRCKRSLSLLMCDIDHFKRVNDRYGHTVGDEVLKGFVECMGGCIRADIDWVVRFGGEEFLIVLPETGVDGVRDVGERLRRAVEETPLKTSGDALSITASFGGTGFGPGEPPNLITVRNLLVTADNLLYSSKNNGRNRVTIGPLIGIDAES